MGRRVYAKTFEESNQLRLHPVILGNEHWAPTFHHSRADFLLRKVSNHSSILASNSPQQPSYKERLYCLGKLYLSIKHRLILLKVLQKLHQDYPISLILISLSYAMTLSYFEILFSGIRSLKPLTST